MSGGLARGGVADVMTGVATGGVYAALSFPWVAIPAAVLVGLSLGLLGSGGSILAVPLLRTVVGLPFAVAKATSFPIVGLAAAAALCMHVRQRSVRVRDALPFVLASVPAAFVSSRELAPRVPELVQTLLFAALMLVAAWRMATGAPDDGDPARRRPVAIVALFGAIAGMLTGLLGVGGGFLIVPSLVLTLGFDVRSAVATSLLVIVLNCGAGLLADQLGPKTPVRWDLAALFSAVGIVGALAGQRLARRFSPLVLRRTFAAVVLVAAVALAAMSF